MPGRGGRPGEGYVPVASAGVSAAPAPAPAPRAPLPRVTSPPTAGTAVPTGRARARGGLRGGVRGTDASCLGRRGSRGRGLGPAGWLSPGGGPGLHRNDLVAEPGRPARLRPGGGRAAVGRIDRISAAASGPAGVARGRLDSPSGLAARRLPERVGHSGDGRAAPGRRQGPAAGGPGRRASVRGGARRVRRRAFPLVRRSRPVHLWPVPRRPGRRVPDRIRRRASAAPGRDRRYGGRSRAGRRGHRPRRRSRSAERAVVPAGSPRPH